MFQDAKHNGNTRSDEGDQTLRETRSRSGRVQAARPNAYNPRRTSRRSKNVHLLSDITVAVPESLTC